MRTRITQCHAAPELNMSAKPRPLSPAALAAIPTVAGVCAVLRGWGRPDLADRIAYFASDADLDDGDVPLTLASAVGFLAFFGAVESADGTESLTCSPEGWLLSVWRFPDLRRISLWFMDCDTVMFAIRKADGKFVLDLNNGSEIASRDFITEQLLQSEEWFTWYRDSQAASNLPPRTMSPDIAAPVT